MREVLCPACSTVNRIAPGKPAAQAKCGKCGAAIFRGEPVEIDDAGLRSRVGRTRGALLVDVWAPWCGPCRQMAPHFHTAAARLEPDVQLLKLNSDENQRTAADLGIRGIPTLILFRDGVEIARKSGAMTADQIVSWALAMLDRAEPRHHAQ
jgi:thioredoxin 2